MGEQTEQENSTADEQAQKNTQIGKNQKRARGQSRPKPELVLVVPKVQGVAELQEVESPTAKAEMHDQDEAKQRRCGSAQYPQSSRAVARGHQDCNGVRSVHKLCKERGHPCYSQTFLYIYIYNIIYPTLATPLPPQNNFQNYFQGVDSVFGCCTKQPSLG